MKKMIAMAFVAITMMTSCSDDDSSNTNNPDPNGPLLTKVVETFGDETHTTLYHYDGNRLTHFGDDSSGGYEFTYMGDKLTKIEFVSENNDDEQVNVQTFEYNEEGKLAVEILTYSFMGTGSTIKTVFTHNSNGTISYEKYVGDEDSQTELTESGTITMQNGNIVAINGESDGEEWTNTFTYDNKNAPLKNIHAYDVLVLSSLSGGLNNILTANYGDEGVEASTTYTYNDEGYPATSSDTWDGEFDGDYEYFYE